mmetsp:Transcript_48851/g.150826  ORF Transcript_48851/g.150826 Transcript_48851/m.150826 type:complete len:262 (-) Transcript_48851:25-810(-)
MAATLEGEVPEDLELRGLGVHGEVVDARWSPEARGGEDLLEGPALGREAGAGAVALHRHGARLLLDVGLDGVLLEGHHGAAGPAPDAVGHQLAARPVSAEVGRPAGVGLGAEAPPAQAALEEEGVGEVHGVEGAHVHENALAAGAGAVEASAAHEVLVDEPVLLPLREGAGRPPRVPQGRAVRDREPRVLQARRGHVRSAEVLAANGSVAHERGPGGVEETAGVGALAAALSRQVRQHGRRSPGGLAQLLGSEARVFGRQE